MVLVAPAAAQQPAALQPIDGIVAVVGQRIILLSEVDEEINQRRGQGLQLPADSAGLVALRRQVLSDLIDDEVLFVRARLDTSITVTDAEVQSAVEEQVRQVRSQFRTDQEYRTALAGAGLGTPEEYRRWITEKQRRSAYQQRFLQRMQQEGKLRSGTVSETELRGAYQAAMAQSQRRRPPTISFRQVVVAPRPTATARARARLLAESVQVELERGADFADAVRRFTSDVSTREAGGDLGFFRRGMMVRAFEDVAFQLRPGVISPVVETQYGYHIIQVERVLPAEVKARHILFSPEITDADLAAARALADSAARLVRGGASADSLARLWGDTAEPRQVGPADRTQMNPAYTQAFAGVEPGSVVGPFEMNPETPQRIRFVVVQVTDVQPERDFTFDEVRDQLRTNMLRERGIRNLLTDLRRRTYVDVRM
jgi:peptidyl-prolyl cis-trans isomerase SurA